jgi:pyrimidine-specific ribonucleoside hydrolase
LTHQALADPSVIERMAEMEHIVGQTCAAWMGFFGTSYNRIWEFEAPPVHDPCTVAALIDPNLVAWRRSFVAVELDGTWTRGTTVVDLYGRYPEQTPNVEVAMTLDTARYWDVVLDAVDRVGRDR